MYKRIILETISLMLAFLFLYTGASKLIDYDTFKVQIAASPILENFSGLIAWLLPLTELIVVALLIIPRFRRWGLYISATLMIIFTIYVASILEFSSHLPCSCGGVLEEMSWRQHLLFNIFFSLLALIACYLERQQSNNGRRNTTTLLFS